MAPDRRRRSARRRTPGSRRRRRRRRALSRQPRRPDVDAADARPGPPADEHGHRGSDRAASSAGAGSSRASVARCGTASTCMAQSIQGPGGAVTAGRCCIGRKAARERSSPRPTALEADLADVLTVHAAASAESRARLQARCGYAIARWYSDMFRSLAVPLEPAPLACGIPLHRLDAGARRRIPRCRRRRLPGPLGVGTVDAGWVAPRVRRRRWLSTGPHRRCRARRPGRRLRDDGGLRCG